MNKIEYTARKLNSLKQTLIKSFEAINSTSNDPKYYYETIWDLMNQKSNIKEMFVKATLSKQIYLFVTAFSAESSSSLVKIILSTISSGSTSTSSVNNSAVSAMSSFI